MKEERIRQENTESGINKRMEELRKQTSKERNKKGRKEGKKEGYVFGKMKG